MPLLSVRRQGSGSTILWLHGFTQTAASAHQFRSILAGTHELMTLDLPGHGESASISATLDETADMIAASLPLEPMVVAGYSLGGRVALHVALRHPDKVRALVLLSATRGIADPRARAERRARDEALADRIEEIGVDKFLDEWLAQPMFTRLENDPVERRSRSVDARGLANSLRSSGTGTQAWLDPLLATIEAPTLCVSGLLDAKFHDEANAMVKRLARGATGTVLDAGHAAHLEQPEIVAGLITNFISRS